MKLMIHILFLTAISFHISAQITDSRIESIKSRLDLAKDDIPQLNNKVTFSISGVSLYEFLRGLAVNNKFNMDVDPSLDTLIAVNFTDVVIRDLLIYLSDEYDLEILINSNIISVIKYFPPPEPVPVRIPKALNISYNADLHTITYDLQNDTLGSVLKKITQLSNINIISAQKLQTVLISGYVKDVPMEKGMNELAYINNLTLNTKDSTTYYLEEPAPKPTINSTETANKTQMPPGLKIVTNHKDSILSLQANNLPIKEVLSAVANQLGIDYFVFTEIKGNTDLRLNNADLNTFLKYLFNGTDYTYRYNNGMYLIGDRKQEAIRTADVYPLKYRTTTKFIELIPSDLRKGIEIIAVPDLNSLVISGSAPAVNELEAFLRQIDKTVPVINIELIILDVTNTHDVSTGISSGIDKTRTPAYTSLFPTLDVTLGANTINSIINGINGMGLVNLGKINSGFYLSLKASEDNGSIKIHSTPRLATLNGSEAQMTIGETRYYAEQTSNVIATQNTTTVSSTIYKPLQANLTVTIKPIVSGDEEITLDITLEQASFTNQVSTNGPYGQTNRTFKSSLRVKNNDMILLGGLEEKDDSNSGEGVPGLSRIPILKWLFSSRSSNVKKSKLAILIHPTVFY